MTNAPRPNAELLLHGLGLHKCPSVLVVGEELARGKPDPLPYLTALTIIGGRSDRALAFEDSLSGARSASGALERFTELVAQRGEHLQEWLKRDP